MAVKYTLNDVLPGPPTKFSYTEIATGDTIVRNSKFPDDEVVGDEPQDGGDEAITSGHTTFVESPEGAEQSSFYGTSAIGSRTFKTKDPDKDINMGDGVRSLYNKWSLHNYMNR
jgi:hypothetical protein